MNQSDFEAIQDGCEDIVRNIGGVVTDRLTAWGVLTLAGVEDIRAKYGRQEIDAALQRIFGEYDIDDSFFDRVIH